jgi:hypothetical protein
MRVDGAVVVACMVVAIVMRLCLTVIMLVMFMAFVVVMGIPVIRVMIIVTTVVVVVIVIMIIVTVVIVMIMTFVVTIIIVPIIIMVVIIMIMVVIRDQQRLPPLLVHQDQNPRLRRQRRDGVAQPGRQRRSDLHDQIGCGKGLSVGRSQRKVMRIRTGRQNDIGRLPQDDRGQGLHRRDIRDDGWCICHGCAGSKNEGGE